MTKIKICGITREVDARNAIELGADALGFVFFKHSKRAVTAQTVTWIKQLPTFVQLVGLFVNPKADDVHTIINQLPLELLQFHGNESPAFCEQFNRRYLKAVPMQGLNRLQANRYISQYQTASAFLLDNYGVSEMGGSGTAFDHQEIPPSEIPLIIAGGLTPENVATVVKTTRPYAVDVSSGVEHSPGIKSSQKLSAFIHAVKTA